MRKSLLMGKWTRVEKAEEDLWEIPLALLPPQGYCAPGLLSSPKGSQVCVDIPTGLYSARSDIVFIPVEFLVCYNLEWKKETESISSSVAMLDYCDPSTSVTSRWQNLSFNLWTIFCASLFTLLREYAMLPRERVTSSSLMRRYNLKSFIYVEFLSCTIAIRLD